MTTHFRTSFSTRALFTVHVRMVRISFHSTDNIDLHLAGKLNILSRLILINLQLWITEETCSGTPFYVERFFFLKFLCAMLKYHALVKRFHFFYKICTCICTSYSIVYRLSKINLRYPTTCTRWKVTIKSTYA